MTNHTEICTKIQAILKEKLFHPQLEGRALEDRINQFAVTCEASSPASTDEFVQHVNNALKVLGVTNTAFWARPGRALAPQWGINATFKMFLDGQTELWVFKNVLAGGIAEQAGVVPGDVLLAIDGLPITSEPRFHMGKAYELTVLGRDNKTQKKLSVTLPSAGPKNRPPMAEPAALKYSVVKSQIGLLRVSAFPAIIGFDFARQLSSAIAELEKQECDRLIVDLRANCGGGLGSIRLMSFFTPVVQSIGYSLSRSARDAQTNPSALPAIHGIPRTKLGLYTMALRFILFQRSRSLRLMTEGLGKKLFHGRIVLLVDESSRSGSEMVAGFAQEAKLATIVGSKTPGETLGAANFKIGEEYRLRIPLVGWYTASDRLIEGRGITPDHEVSPSLAGLRAGTDELFEKALALVA
jgi:carboxyl-terminal processing protease